MQRRIFIGISLPQAAKRLLEKKIGQWQDWPVHWTDPDNLHITLMFLGYMEDQALPAICEKTKQIAVGTDVFDAEMESIEIFPSKTDPKMVWLQGKASEELKCMIQEIESEIFGQSRSKKIYRPHITLGRIKKKEWRDLAGKIELGMPYHLDVPIDSVEIFESCLDNGRRHYVVLDSYPLRG